MTKRHAKLLGRLLVGVLAGFAIFYMIRVHRINSDYAALYSPKGAITVRKFPFPYIAALTISSDIDKTTTAEEFLEIQEFLNTRRSTKMGEGLGLEIGNSFFMFLPGSHASFGYFSQRPFDRIVIKRFIEAGYIDTIHSWGDGYKGRADAIRAIDELESNGLKLTVWVNHARANSDLGRWFPNSYLGDNKDSIFYHSDITIPYGIKYVWLGSSTWIIGQAVPIMPNTFLGSYDSKHALKSAVNISKALSKHLMGILGIEKSRYAMHASNDLIKPVVLDDGRRVYQFMRYDNHFDGIGLGTTSKTMAYNLSDRVFRQLKKVNGYAILYTHFGKNSDCPDAIDETTQRSLRRLADEYRNGKIYVTTQAKLLKYYINHKYLNWSYKIQANEGRIQIKSINDPVFGSSVPAAEDVQGITFYVPAGINIRIFIGDREITDIKINIADGTGRESVSIPITYLTYPDISPEETLR
jgi:hypothetical protein